MDQKTYTGKGVGVATLDTGIWLMSIFEGRICAFFDFWPIRREPYDDNGHGTHVAGILGGSGKASGGKYKGVASQCNIIALKVLDSLGNGNKEDVIRAFSWLIKNKEKYEYPCSEYFSRNDL